ncbi:MAG: isoprenylcysteine carboxylmethyltransferase family protein [Bryobacterales bacterium]|nr:isoprenylcysteine carboxylmethyltransferase family protein [Bryobacterales bacterium]
MFPKRYAGLVQRFRVPCGFLLAFALAWFSKPSPWTLLAGLPFCVAGLALRAWAAGHLRKNQTLTTSGPYGWMRNPLYLGSLMLAGGFVVASGVWWLGLLFGGVFVLIYLPVIEQEEEHLRKLFPEFGDYAQRVPLLWPRAPASVSTAGFDPAQWRRNEEYKALLASVIGYALLALKSVPF